MAATAMTSPTTAGTLPSRFHGGAIQLASGIQRCRAHMRAAAASITIGGGMRGFMRAAFEIYPLVKLYAYFVRDGAMIRGRPGRRTTRRPLTKTHADYS